MSNTPPRNTLPPEQAPAPVEERKIYQHPMTLDARIEGLGNIMNMYCVGKHIKDICPHGYANPALNHCAHAVSHILGYEGRPGASTCKNQKLDTKSNREIGALISVDDIYNAMHIKKSFQGALPAAFHRGLVYVTTAGNMIGTKMNDGGLKHVGIWDAGRVWHYGNTLNHFTSDTLAEFIRKFTATYGKNRRQVVFFYSGFEGNFT